MGGKADIVEQALKLIAGGGAESTATAAARAAENAALLKDARRLGVDTSNVGELKETQALTKFHKGFMDDLKTRSQQLGEVYNQLRDSGAFPLEVGTRFTTAHSRDRGLPPWTVTGYHVNPKDPYNSYGYKVRREYGNGDYEETHHLIRDPKLEAIHGDKWNELQQGVVPMTGPRVTKEGGGSVRKGYATQGAVQPGPVFIEDAKGTRYDTAGNIIPPAQDQVTDALSVARRETVDPYLMVPGHENLTRVPPVAGPSPEYVRGEAVSAATQPSRDVFWQGVEQFRNPQTEPRTPARAWELLSGAGQIGLGAIGTGFSGAIGAGVEMLPTWLTGPQNQRNKLASELNEMAMFADPMMGPEALAATAPLQRVGGIKNAAAVEGDLAKQRMLERGPSKFYDPLRVSSGIDPTQAGKALANAKDAAIAKVGDAVDPALKAAQEAIGGDQVAAATRAAQIEALNPVPPPQGIFPPTNAFQTAPAIPFDAPTKAFVQFGKPIPPTTPLPDPQLVSSAQADTRMGADIVKRRLPVIVPEQERVVGGIYTPGAPDGRRWSELTPQELAARGPGAKFTDNDLQTIWNQTLAEVSEAGRQAVANTGATWSVFPAEQWDKALKLPLRSQLWYELSGEAFVDRLPDLKYNEHMMFLDLVGATSARARPGENLERALGVLSQRLRGVPVDVDVTIPSTVSAALRRDGRNVSSDLANKTGMFSDTLALTGGLPVRYPISVNDVWVGKAFGITDDQLSSNQALHEVFGKYTNKLRDLVNNTSPGQHPHQSWNLQARQWVELRAADEGIDTSLPVSVDGSDYAGEWDKIAAKLERAGIALPDGRITRDVLLDPRLADALRPTTPGFRAAPKATVEFGTLLTPNGQKSAQIYERARQAGDQNTQDEYLAALTTAMYRTARGKPTLWEETARAALGDTTSVTRIYSPTTDDPFAISGTFGGAAAPNIRVPLRNLTPDQIAYFNAMAGNGLRQKAMAAVEIGRLEPGQALPKGAVPSSSVRFDFSGPIPQKMLTDFASSLGEGFEISAMRYPDGVVFDINPRFGDAGPEAPSVKAVDDAIKSLAATYGIENPRVFDISYKSEYGKNYVEDPGDGTGYGQIINGTLKKWEADTVAQLQSITEGKVSNAVLKKFLKGDDAALRDAAKAGGFPISGYTGRAKTVRKVFQQRLSDHASLTAKWEAVGKEVDDKLGSLIPKWERRQSTATKKAEKGNAPLSPEQRSTNFQSAFGQTYLKNPQGNPMRLYHMTPNDITEFSASPENRSGPVVFLSPYADFQPAYHQAAELNELGKFTSTFKEGANVMPVYADVRNPLVLDHPRKIKEAAAKYQGGDRKFPRIITPEAKAAMEADGFDAIIFGGDNPIPYGDRPMDARLGHQEARDEEFIIFNPGKIKSATGNRGTYDMNNPDITKALGGAIEDDDDNIYHAVRLARDVGGATNENPQVMMTDANGVQYDATGKVIQTATPQANSNSSAAPSPTTPEEVGRRAAEDPVTFDAMMERYAVPDRDIVDYEALKKEVSQQPQPVQQMTHVGAPPMRDIKVDMPLFGGEYNVGQAPYDIANPMSGVAQTAYDLKTVPLYFTPWTAPIGAGMDVAEGIATGDPLTASLAMAFGPGGKMAKAAGIGAANYFIDPSEAEAGPARWFSKAMEVAREIPMNKMTGEQALAMLRKGTSPEEIRWTGADAFLQGKPTVTKEELVDYLNKNRVKLDEFRLGGEKPKAINYLNQVDKDILERYQPKLSAAEAEHKKALDYFHSVFGSEAEESAWQLVTDSKRNLTDVQLAAMQEMKDRIGIYLPTKYQDYSTSGGEGYAETLYTLGNRKKPRVENRNGMWSLVDENGNVMRAPHGGEYTYWSEGDANRAAGSIHRGSGLYQSGHWDQPDVLAHSRSQTLSYDPPGANRPYRVHNVDETQSDWGQAARRKGIYDPQAYNKWESDTKETKEAIRDLADKLTMRADEIDETLGPKPTRWHGDEFTNYHERRQAAIAADPNIEEMRKQIEDYRLKLMQLDENKPNLRGVPNAPFIGSTEGWTDLAIKKQLDSALDSDADYFSWTPGEVHADRYDLSRHIGSVMYDPYYEKFTAFDPNGKRVLSEGISDTQKLDNYVGKELGDKIRSLTEEKKSNFYDGITIEENADGNYAVLRHGKPTMMSGGYGDWFHTKSEAAEFVDKSFGESLKENPIQLSGLDLKTGGEGMKGYYDKVYLKRIQDVIKRATGEKPVIEEIEVQTGNGSRKQLGIRLTDEMREKARFSDFNRGGTVTAPSSYGNDNPAVSRAIALTREY